MKKSLLAALLSVIVVLALAGTGSALTLTSVDGNWLNPVGGAGIVYQSDSVVYGNGMRDQIRWGSSTAKSGLGFTGNLPAPFNPEDAFEIGQLTHFNNPIPAGTAASAVDIQLLLAFSDPLGLGGSFQFNFSINETSNIYSPPSNPGNDDFIYFPSSFSDQTMDISGTIYTLKILGFGSAPGNLISQFRSSEGSENNTRLWGKITTETPPNPIPVPDGGATLILLGNALAVVFAVSRRIRG